MVVRNEMVLGLDIGGTNMRVGLFKGLELVNQYAEPLRNPDDEKDTLNQLIGLIHKLFCADVKAIGLGVPSVVDPVSGTVYNAVNIPSWVEVPLRKIIEKIFQKPVFVNNDANCFALGEFYFGAGKAKENMVGLILGTGTGAGIISNGKLLAGRNNGAGEFGMIPYHDADFEHYCSGGFFEQTYGISSLKAFQLATNNENEGLKIWDVFGKHLAELIKVILFSVDPEMIVIGGGLAQAYPFYYPSLIESLKDFAFKNSLEHLKIEKSSLSNAALYGAASLYYDYNR